ncbi:Hypothetical protein, putative [Bodo saltans]|uniref:Uncharacterized protein n=1 Tax=Bodo saltans TaxID=75058 RepID=A0A0S4JVA2_BODSA|nr:Hypothetical protein, putative [Bodo saltans]|eukprot:CUG93359.1 Hypothetical protein, putative [Bodo saltans]
MSIVLATSCICWKLGCWRCPSKSIPSHEEQHDPDTQTQMSLPALPPTSRRVHHDEPFDPLPGVIMPPQSLAFPTARSSSTDDGDSHHHRIHVVTNGSPASPSKISEYGSFKLYRTGYKHIPPTESSVVTTVDLLDWDMIESLRGVSVDQQQAHNFAATRDGIETPIKQQHHEERGGVVRPSALRLRPDRSDGGFEHVVGETRSHTASPRHSPRHAVVSIFPEDSFDERDERDDRSDTSRASRSSLWEWEFAELPEEAVVSIATVSRQQQQQQIQQQQRSPPQHASVHLPFEEAPPIHAHDQARGDVRRPVPPTSRVRSRMAVSDAVGRRHLNAQHTDSKNPFAELEEEDE